MTEIGTGSGVSVYRDEAGALHVVDACTGGLYTAVFVTGLIAGLTGLAGTGMFGLGLIRGTGLWILGAVLLGVGAVAGGVLRFAWRRLRGRRDAPVADKRSVAIFDLPAEVLRDGRGRVAGPLTACTVRRKMQWASSSPRLVVIHPGGEWTLCHGNPFGGGLGTIEDALRRHGVG